MSYTALWDHGGSQHSLYERPVGCGGKLSPPTSLTDSCGSELLLTAGREVEGGEAVELLTDPNNVSSLLPQTPFHPGANCADRHLVD